MNDDNFAKFLDRFDPFLIGVLIVLVMFVIAAIAAV